MLASQNLRHNSSRTPILQVAFTVLAASLLSGCGTLVGPAPLARQLPGPPSYLQPVDKPAANAGDSAFVVAERRGAVIDQQNTVIVRARTAWQTMQATYGGAAGSPKVQWRLKKSSTSSQ